MFLNLQPTLQKNWWWHTRFFLGLPSNTHKVWWGVYIPKLKQKNITKNHNFSSCPTWLALLFQIFKWFFWLNPRILKWHGFFLLIHLIKMVCFITSQMWYLVKRTQKMDIFSQKGQKMYTFSKIGLMFVLMVKRF